MPRQRGMAMPRHADTYRDAMLYSADITPLMLLA